MALMWLLKTCILCMLGFSDPHDLHPIISFQHLFHRLDTRGNLLQNTMFFPRSSMFYVATKFTSIYKWFLNIWTVITYSRKWHEQTELGFHSQCCVQLCYLLWTDFSLLRTESSINYMNIFWLSFSSSPLYAVLHCLSTFLQHSYFIIIIIIIIIITFPNCVCNCYSWCIWVLFLMSPRLKDSLKFLI